MTPAPEAIGEKLSVYTRATLHLIKLASSHPVERLALDTVAIYTAWTLP